MGFIYKAAKPSPPKQVAEIERIIADHVPDFVAAHRKFSRLLGKHADATPITRDGKAAAAHLTTSPRAKRIFDIYRSDLEDAFTALAEDAGAYGLRMAGIADKMKFAVHKARDPKKEKRIGVPINEYSKKWITKESSNLIVQISEDVRKNARNLVAQGYKQNLHPDVTRTKIGQSVGLFDRLAKAVSNRYDATVKANLKAGASITDAHAKAKEVSDEYADDLIDYRGEMIGRTEGKWAQNRAQEDSWKVARDEGLMPAGARKQWITIFDQRTAEACKELDGQIVGLDEDFDSEDYGNVERPPLFPNCRCTIGLVFGGDDDD